MTPKHTQNVQVRIDVKDLASIVGYVNSKNSTRAVVPKGTCLRRALEVFAKITLEERYSYIDNNADALKLLETLYGKGKVDSNSIIADMTSKGGR